MSKTAKKFVFDIGWASISQMFLMITGFLLNVILGRSLGASAFGLFTMTFTIYTMSSLFGSLGIPSAIVRYVAAYKENREKINTFASCGVINSLLLGIFICAVLFAFSNTFAKIFNMPELSELIRIASLGLPFLMLNNVLISIFNGLREMKSYASRNIIRSILLLALTVLLLYLGWGVKGAVLALVLSEILTSLFLIKIIKCTFNFILYDFLPTTKELIKFGSQLFLANVIWVTNTYADTLLVGYFLTDKDVGIYAVAVAVARVLRMLSGIVSTVTYPAISEYHSKGLKDSIETLINEVMRYVLALLSVIGLFIILFAKDIILILFKKSEYSLATSPLQILVIGTIFFGAVGAVGAAFSGVGRPDIAWKISFTALVVGIVSDLTLIPTIGIVGAAIGTTLSLLSVLLIMLILFNKILHIKIKAIQFIKISLLIFVVFSLNLVLEKYTYSQNYYFGKLFLLFMYILLLYIVKIITIDDLKYIKNILC